MDPWETKPEERCLGWIRFSWIWVWSPWKL